MRRLLVIAVCGVPLVLGAQPALAAPPTDGCPRGYAVWDISAEPYQQDDAADHNGNGIVCARQLGGGASSSVGADGPVYVFGDDDLAASGRAR